MANGRARSLRKRLTVAEQRLWDELKLLRPQGHHFRRQAPIGPYIVDFVCFSSRLVIEVDGIGHDVKGSRLADARRDRDLHWRGFDVVRFQNSDVMEKLDGVMREILVLLGQSSSPIAVGDIAQSIPPPLSPPHQGEGDARAATRPRSVVASQPARRAQTTLNSGKPFP
jgi:very-short-patch-repair endonuclease